MSYLRFVKRLILEDFSPGSLSEEEELMLAMFHYDMWQKSGAELGFVDFRESVKNGDGGRDAGGDGLPDV